MNLNITHDSPKPESAPQWKATISLSQAKWFMKRCGGNGKGNGHNKQWYAITIEEVRSSQRLHCLIPIIQQNASLPSEISQLQSEFQGNWCAVRSQPWS